MAKDPVLYVETDSLFHPAVMSGVPRFTILRSSFHLDSGKPVFMCWSAHTGVFQMEAIAGTGSWREKSLWNPTPRTLARIVGEAGAERFRDVVLVPRWGGYHALRDVGGVDALSWHNFSEDFKDYDSKRHDRVKRVFELFMETHSNHGKTGLPIVTMSDAHPDVFMVDIPKWPHDPDDPYLESWVFNVRPDGNLLDWVREAVRL